MNQIFQRVEADLAISVTDLKRNPAAAFEAAESQAVAVLNHNRVVGYIISPVAWEGMLEALDDLNIIDMLSNQKSEQAVEVSLDDLAGPIHAKRGQKLEQARRNSARSVRKGAAAPSGRASRPGRKTARPPRHVQDQTA